MGEDNKTKSGRKTAAEGFQDYKEHLMAVLNCIADPICVKDRQHKWVLVNDAFCEISPQALAKRVRDILDFDLRKGE